MLAIRSSRALFGFLGLQTALRVREALFLFEKILLPARHLRASESLDVLESLLGHGIRGLDKVSFQRAGQLDASVLQAPPEQLLESFPIDGRSMLIN